jgi:DNA-binding IclR family transcriptional regulator
MSNEQVAYDVEMPLSTLNNCIKALVEAGMLARESRGMGLTHLWILNWNAIETSSRAASGSAGPQASKPVPRLVPR